MKMLVSNNCEFLRERMYIYTSTNTYISGTWHTAESFNGGQADLDWVVGSLEALDQCGGGTSSESSVSDGSKCQQTLYNVKWT